MATRTSNGTGGGDWSSGSSWAGGIAPVDNDTVVVAATDTITVDVDMSAYPNGIAGITITGHADSPGTLNFKDTAGTYWLKMKTGTNIEGTALTAVFGRLQMGSGKWGSTVAPGASCQQVLEFVSTSAGRIIGTYLAAELVCNEPTNAYVEVYKTAYGPVAQSTNVTPADDYIDWGTPPPAVSTTVRVRSTGTLPTPLRNDDLYYVVSVSGNKCKLSLQNDTAQTVDITDTGSGNITMYDGHTNTSTATVNVLQDVTGDTSWSTTSGKNAVCLVDMGPANALDIQFATLNTINVGTLVLSANVDSAQFPLARIYIAYRNVRIVNHSTSASQSVIDLTSFVATTTNNWTIACGIIAGAATTSITTYCYGVTAGTSLGGTSVATATITVSGGIFFGIAQALYNSPRIAITGGIFCGGGNMFYGCLGATMSGGTVCGYTRCDYYCVGLIITGGTICGCLYAFSPCRFTILDGGTVHSCYHAFAGGYPLMLSGSIRCCNHAIYPWDFGIHGELRGGEIVGCSYVAQQFGGRVHGGMQLSYNNCSFVYPRGMVGYGVICNNKSLPMSTYLGIYESIKIQGFGCTIYDYGANKGYIGRWDTNGYTISAAYDLVTHGTPPVPYTAGPPTCIHVTTVQWNGAEHWVEFPLLGYIDKSLTVEIYAKQPSAGVFDTLPTWEIVDKDNAVAAEVLDTCTLTNNTNWQTFTLRSGMITADRPLFLRMRCAGGNSSGTGSDTLYWFQVLKPAASFIGVRAK